MPPFFFLLRFSVGIINGGCRRECHHPNLLPVKEKVAPTVDLLQLLCCPQIVRCASTTGWAMIQTNVDLCEGFHTITSCLADKHKTHSVS